MTPYKKLGFALPLQRSQKLDDKLLPGLPFLAIAMYCILFKARQQLAADVEKRLVLLFCLKGWCQHVIFLNC